MSNPKTSGEPKFDGGCTCGSVRYQMTARPLFVHCCHCRWCQRESGSAFALNALIEWHRVRLIQGQTERVPVPTNSGKGQDFHRCPHCKMALWSHYAGAGDLVSFVRVGTLDQPELLPPDIHIFTASKQPWVTVSPGIPARTGYYNQNKYWPEESLTRFAKLIGQGPR